MRSITFTVSKGGVGKSLLTANVGAALAKKGKKVVLVEGDTNQPLRTVLGLTFSPKDFKLEDAVEKDTEINKAVYRTQFDNLFLIPSGVSLQGYFEIDPIRFARKLCSLETDFMLVDVPFPLGKAAFLSLGLCEYFVPILTEDEFVLCVESTIDTLRLGKYFLKSIPLGFILNRIKTPEKFTKGFVEDLENLLEVSCIAQITEDPEVAQSYGGVGSKKPFLAYSRPSENEFTKEIDKIAAWLLNKTKNEEKDVIKLLQEVINPPKL
ncbi:MAG: MinD/ParA family protein [Candidatus Bathyarchaeia archaeon]|jgi:septum site-determining protein MinD